MKFIAVVLFIFIINVLFDVYVLKRLGKLSLSIIKTTYLVVLFLGIIIPITAILMLLINISGDGLLFFMWLMLGYVVLFLPKLVYVVLSIFGKLFRGIFNKGINYFALILSVLTLGILLYSALITSRIPKVKCCEIECENLPNGFDGFKIVHISDFHLGSLGKNTGLVANVVETVNELNPDVILFSGDLVNSLASEAYRFQEELSKFSANQGVYSVLGNHDYGDYYKWESDSLKKDNLKRLMQLQRDCGWNLLNNEHVILKNENDSIVLIGVENWGEYPFPKYGDLNEAYDNLNDNLFKILISHNPVHWREEVLPMTNIDLTLSGHTHAMQCVIEMFGRSWSLSELKYDEWGGLYEADGQRLYVNAGLGYVGLPLRVGVNPEITLITLNKKTNRE